MQYFRNANGAIGALMIFHHGDNRAADRDGGAVKSMNQMRALLAFDAVANVESSSLIVGAVGGAGHFAPFAVLASAGIQASKSYLR